MMTPETNSPKHQMAAWISASLDFIRSAFQDGSGEEARARAARLCHVLGDLLGGASSEGGRPETQGARAPAPYRPGAPPTLAEYIAHLVEHPAELAQLLPPELLAFVAPLVELAASPMVRGIVMRQVQAPAYRGG